MIKQGIQKILSSFGYVICRKGREPYAEKLYKPLYCPWESAAFDRYFNFASGLSLVSRDRCFVLERLLRHASAIPGDLAECGVYRGGTARMFAEILAEVTPDKSLYLFDTFEGMPQTDPKKDFHKKGDFSDTSYETIKALFTDKPNVKLVKGWIPDSFNGHESLKFSFCHIDVDIYRSIHDSLNFLWPRLAPGGVVVFDDYGFPSCPGARESVDEFFSGKDEYPLALATGQAVVIKHPTRTIDLSSTPTHE